MTVDKEENKTIRKELELLYQKGKDNQAITGGIGGASDFNTNNDINECVVNIETILDECQTEYDGFDWSHLVVQGIREYRNNIRESLGVKRINYYGDNMNSNPTTLSVDEQIDEILNINLFDVDCKVYKMLDINETKKKVLSLIRKVCEEVIGQDDVYDETSCYDSGHYSGRQDLRDEQRTKLNKILGDINDNKK